MTKKVKKKHTHTQTRRVEQKKLVATQRKKTKGKRRINERILFFFLSENVFTFLLTPGKCKPFRLFPPPNKIK